MLEYDYAYTATLIPTMKAFFRDNQVKVDGGSDQVIGTGVGYRRRRFKGMIHTFLGIERRLFSSVESTGSSLVARRQNLSGADLQLGYDVANSRNQRVFINAGVGSIRYEYNLFRATNQVVNFQNILQSPPSSGIPSLFLASGYWDVNVEMSQREKHQNSFQLVSRIGYRRSFQSTAWQSDAYQLTDVIQDRISQFYLQIGLYFSRNRLARRKP